MYAHPPDVDDRRRVAGEDIVLILLALRKDLNRMEDKGPGLGSQIVAAKKAEKQLRKRVLKLLA
jgi:hypothetical protein